MGDKKTNQLCIVWNDDLKPGARPDGKEAGRLLLLGPEGEIKGDYGFLCGGHDKGCIPILESYRIDTKGGYNAKGERVENSGRDIRNFTINAKTMETLPGLRLDDASFKAHKRSGILIHYDNGVAGTRGCIGICQKSDWEHFAGEWKKIPPDARPEHVAHMPKAEYDALKLENAARAFKASTETGTSLPYKTGALQEGQIR